MIMQTFENFPHFGYVTATLPTYSQAKTLFRPLTSTSTIRIRNLGKVNHGEPDSIGKLKKRFSRNTIHPSSKSCIELSF